MSIAKTALALIQQDLHVPKNQFNKYGEFYYRNAEDIYKAVKEVIAAHKMMVLFTLTDDLVMIGERYYIKATATLESQDGNDKVQVTAYAREEEKRPKMAEPMLTGSASSYARKYACNSLFLLDDAADPDKLDNRQQGKKKPVKKKEEGVGEMPDWKPPDQIVNGLIPLIDKCETVQGVEQLYKDNRHDIDSLPEGQKADLLAYFGERKEALKTDKSITK